MHSSTLIISGYATSSSLLYFVVSLHLPTLIEYLRSTVDSHLHRYVTKPTNSRLRTPDGGWMESSLQMHLPVDRIVFSEETLENGRI